MRASVVVGALAFGILVTARPAGAQVEAGVVIRSGPISGHVIVGEPAPVVVYPVPRPVVVVDRYAPRVVVVEPIYVRRGWSYGWWGRYGYRPVFVYYDGARYYDRWFDGRGVRRVEVYQRDGRYYRYYHRHDWDD